MVGGVSCVGGDFSQTADRPVSLTHHLNKCLDSVRFRYTLLYVMY